MRKLVILRFATLNTSPQINECLHLSKYIGAYAFYIPKMQMIRRRVIIPKSVNDGYIFCIPIRMNNVYDVPSSVSDKRKKSIGRGLTRCIGRSMHFPTS